MERSNWTVAFAWVKAHAGLLRNELADQLAKTSARVKDKTTSNSRITLSTLFRESEEESKPKAAQTKQFYPRKRTDIIDITSNFTAMVSGHDKTRAYLLKFKLLKCATCPCNKGD